MAEHLSWQSTPYGRALLMQRPPHGRSQLVAELSSWQSTPLHTWQGYTSRHITPRQSTPNGRATRRIVHLMAEHTSWLNTPHGRAHLVTACRAHFMAYHAARCVAEHTVAKHTVAKLTSRHSTPHGMRAEYSSWQNTSDCRTLHCTAHLVTPDRAHLMAYHTVAEHTVAEHTPRQNSLHDRALLIAEHSS
jgi:hypothetical protein